MVKAMKKQSKFAPAASAFRVRITTAAEPPAKKTPVLKAAPAAAEDASPKRVQRKSALFPSKKDKYTLTVAIDAPVSEELESRAVIPSMFEDEGDLSGIDLAGLLNADGKDPQLDKKNAKAAAKHGVIVKIPAVG